MHLGAAIELTVFAGSSVTVDGSWSFSEVSSAFQSCVPLMFIHMMIFLKSRISKKGAEPGAVVKYHG